MTPAPRRTGLALLLALSLAGVAGCKQAQAQPDADPWLRSQLAAHREQQIQRLHAYAVAGEFPHNMTSPHDLHMFRDAEGRYCAVANLIHQDGRDDLVDATVRERNDLAIHDVHDGPMMTWILGSGLTQEELERIQLPAPRPQVWMEPAPPQPTPDQIAIRERPFRVLVTARDEDSLKALVRAHVAVVEAELRANTDASLTVATKRAHGEPAPERVASR